MEVGNGYIRQGERMINEKIVVEDKTYTVKDAVEHTPLGSSTCNGCAFLDSALTYCQDVIKPTAKEQLKSKYPLNTLVGGCGINKVIFIEDSIESIMNYLEVKLNEGELK